MLGTVVLNPSCDPLRPPPRSFPWVSREYDDLDYSKRPFFNWTNGPTVLQPFIFPTVPLRKSSVTRFPARACSVTPLIGVVTRR